jgi:hypothetical protein
MSTKNDITGDSLTSRVSNQNYRDNYDRIFGSKKVQAAVIIDPTAADDKTTDTQIGLGVLAFVQNVIDTYPSLD